MAANSFTFFASYYEALQYLSDEESGQMIKAICEFAINDIEPAFSNPTLKGYWALVRPILEKSVKRSQAGRKGGQNGIGVSRNQGNTHAVKETNANQINNKTIEDKEIGYRIKDKEMEIGDGKKKEKKNSGRFIPPTVEDVHAYCLDRGNGINAQSFVDFYESKGWKVGSSPMKDWRAAVRTWEQRNGFDPKKKPAPEIKLGVGEYIDKEGNRRYSDILPSVPMAAPPRPSKDYVFSMETNTWIPAGL